MRGRFWCGLHPTALALLPVLLGGHARAAENDPKIITLSCDGVITPAYGANKPEVPQSLQKVSVIVNLDEHTIFFLGYFVPTEDVDGANIHFGGRQSVEYGFSVAINGNIDRATGHMDATLVMSDPTQLPDLNSATVHYGLVCQASSN